MLQISLTILFLIVTYILIVPVLISLRVDSSLSRALRIRIFPFDIRIAPQKKESAKRKKKIDFERLFFDELRTVNQVFPLFWKFVKSLFQLKGHCLNISLQGGFGSPDITGMVLGVIEAVIPAFGNRIIIVYHPDMMAQSVSVNLNLQTVVRVCSVLLQALPLIFRLPMLRIIRILVKITKGEYNARTT